MTNTSIHHSYPAMKQPTRLVSLATKTVSTMCPSSCSLIHKIPWLIFRKMINKSRKFQIWIKEMRNQCCMIRDYIFRRSRQLEIISRNLILCNFKICPISRRLLMNGSVTSPPDLFRSKNTTTLISSTKKWKQNSITVNHSWI